MSKTVLPQGLTNLLKVGSYANRSNEYVDGTAETLVKYAKDYAAYKRFEVSYHDGDPAAVERSKRDHAEVVAHETYQLQMRTVGALLLQAAIQLDLGDFDLTQKFICEAKDTYELANKRFKELDKSREFVLNEDDAFGMFAVLTYQLEQQRNSKDATDHKQ